MKDFPDHKILQTCLLQIEANLGWGKADSWPNEAFDELSSLIQENTSVLLSPTTLKRVWGKVNYQSSPSINTLNTLAQFAGHKNWLDFQESSCCIPAPAAQSTAMEAGPFGRSAIYSGICVFLSIHYGGNRIEGATARAI